MRLTALRLSPSFISHQIDGLHTSKLATQQQWPPNHFVLEHIDSRLRSRHRQLSRLDRDYTYTQSLRTTGRCSTSV